MASNPSTFSPIGMDAMTSFYTIAVGNGMINADVTHFHPNELLNHGGFGLGDTAAATASDMAATFVANNFAASSFATAPAPPRVDHISSGRTHPEEMDEGYGFGSSGAGDSCVPASLQRPDHSDAMAVWSSSKKHTGTWSSAAGDSRAVTVHEPYHHLADVAGFHYSLAAAAAAAAAAGNAPASSELSLCSTKSPSDAALNAAVDQCSSGASRSSAVTELPPPPAMYPPRARHRPAPAHFSVVVARSPYAAVAQEVLNDVVGYMLHGVADVAADSCSGADGGATTSVVSSNRLMAPSSKLAGERRGEAQRVKNDLLKLLQLMDEKYNQFLDEIQSTTAKCSTLMHSGGGGVSNGGGIYAPFAHRAVSAVYGGLRRRIAGEIMAAASRATATCWGESSSSSAAVTTMERSWESAFIKKHWAAQRRRRGEQQCWRPQRGLPEKCVAVLKAWLFENFLHPYPKDHDKEVLAARSGLTRNQVSNWFINARVRLWKPMIEEMYQDLKKSSGVGGQGSAMEMHTSKRRIFELEEGH